MINTAGKYANKKMKLPNHLYPLGFDTKNRLVLTGRQKICIADADMKIIAKIESQTGMNNLESIAEVADGLMVARGDLGVEVPMEDFPICQKRIVKVARKYKKICIVATEMLESMKHNPRPTRASLCSTLCPR